MVVLVVFTAAGSFAATPAAGDVLVDSIGDGFSTVGDTSGTLGSVTRRFAGPSTTVEVMALPVDASLGVDRLFRLITTADVGLETRPADGLGRAVWLLRPGTEVGDDPTAFLALATTEWIFTVLVATEDPEAIDAAGVAAAIGAAQLERVGGPLAPADVVPSAAGGSDDLLALLPGDLGPLRVSGTAEATEPLGATVAVDPEVFEFLDAESEGVVRVWTGGGVRVAASVTRYPYELFAAAALGQVPSTAAAGAIERAVPGAVAFTGEEGAAGEIGLAFRRGDVAVLVLARADGGSAGDATAAAVDVAQAVAALVGDGNDDAYVFPGRRSTVQGLALSSVLVTGAALGAVGVGRARARRVRGRTVAPSPLGAASTGEVVELDADARRLRRRASLVLVGQVVCLDVGVGALAGDFGWRGAQLALVAFVAGIGFTTWWRGHEQRVLGPSAPRTAFLLPRPGGLAMGALALALLGLGVGYGVKGLRYLVLEPTLAQLKWSNFFGISPTAVGVLFALGGIAVAVLGATLFRVARALGRAGTRRTLAADRRPPVLYLRSFDDDDVPLPTIVSARRPFLELFSIRGADPFEESLAWELATYGPVVAVARPGRSAASLGAAREHLSDETWQQQVGERVEDAAVVVMAIGVTQGLRWELHRVVSGGHLGKTLFVFPPLPAEVLQQRWDHTSAALRDAGVATGPLPVAVELVHTVSVRGDGTLVATVAHRRDDASYRTGIDHAVRVLTPTA